VALREGDALAFLRLKELFKPSDCNALFSDGRKLPVIIRPDTGQLAVEFEDRLFDPQKLPGFVKFELKLDEIPSVTPPPPEPTENEIFEHRLKLARENNPNVAGWILQKQVRAEMFQEGLAALQKGRQEQQSTFGTLPDRWASFAAAAKRQRNNIR
jgi:hypothetical protein